MIHSNALKKDLEAWASLKIQTVIRHIKMDENCNFIYLDSIKGKLMARGVHGMRLLWHTVIV